MILYYSGPYSDVLGNYYCGQYKLIDVKSLDIT